MKSLTCAYCGEQFLSPRKKKYCCSDCCYQAHNARRRTSTEPRPASGLSLLRENRRLVLSGVKRCSKCDDIYALFCFRVDNKGLGGRSAYCKQCLSGLDARRRGTEKARLSRRRYKERKRREIGARPRCEIAADAQIKRASELATRLIAKGKREANRDTRTPAERYRDRYRDDPEFQLKERMRRQITKAAKRDGVSELIRAAIRRGGESNRVEALLGYSIGELMNHIERQFTAGMNWEKWKRGEIHLDHIVPQKAFDLTDDGEWRQCWSLSNLQPLWARDNLQKGARLEKII